MTHIRKGAAAAIAAGFVVMTTVAVTVQEQPASTHAVGKAVTLTSCVEKGEKPDTFVLTQTADVPAHPATMGRVAYWLDSVKQLREHVGHQVRVQGTITEVKPSEMEVKLGEDTQGGWTVEIEGPGRDVRTPAGTAGVAGAGRADEEGDVKITLVKLKVTDVVMAAPSCPAM